jgi:predicted  nucleic acid-binding Zn-ribbon protein
MGLPARKFEFEEVTVEETLERMVRLESNVEHLRSDVSEIKSDIKGLHARIDGVDQKLSARIDAADQKSSAKFDSLKYQIADLPLRMEKSLSQLRVWMLTSFITMAGALLTFLAHSLHWF